MVSCDESTSAVVNLRLRQRQGRSTSAGILRYFAITCSRALPADYPTSAPVEAIKREPSNGLVTGGWTLPLVRAEMGLSEQYEFIADSYATFTAQGAKTERILKQKKQLRSLVTASFCLLRIRGRPCGIRTCDQRIKSPLLYQLS